MLIINAPHIAKYTRYPTCTVYGTVSISEAFSKAGFSKTKNQIKQLQEQRKQYRIKYWEQEAYYYTIFTPQDFSFDQKVKIFDFLSDDIIKAAHKSYTRNFAYNEIVTIASKTCTLKKWNESVKEEFEKKLANWLEAQKAIHNLQGYDWRSLNYIFGEDLEILAQNKTAVITAELNTSYELFLKEYQEFLETLKNISQLGTMRQNDIQFKTVLLEKYEINLTIKDIGIGAAFTEKVNNNIVDPTKEIGSLFKDIYKFIFGD